MNKGRPMREIFLRIPYRGSDPLLIQAPSHAMTSWKTDCRHFLGDRPCAPHKLTGVDCSECRDDYDPIQTRMLIVKLAAMGDVLRTTSMLPAIRRRWPAAHITWVTNSESVPLLENNPAIDRILSFSAGAVPLEILSERYDVVVNPDAAPESCALAHLARSGSRVGYAFDERGVPVPLSDGARHWMNLGLSDKRKRANKRTYQELMADVLEVDYRREPPVMNISHEDGEKGRALAEQHATSKHQLLVGLNTGAGGRWRFKRWTEKGYASLIKRLGESGHRVLLLGGPSEVERNARLMRASHGIAVDSGGDNSLGTFAGLVEACDVIVTGDTLAMHVAIARQVPTVVLFGPTSLDEIDVFDRGERIAPELDCLGCYLTDCDVSPNCMESISVDRVYDAVIRNGSLTTAS
ncbi:MAG: glycosyltransferase family 9 protein [Planctomycetota bacterium]|nr:glycosyltransferase family 9 protein [Planctomycetota bacterium]